METTVEALRQRNNPPGSSGSEGASEVELLLFENRRLKSALQEAEDLLNIAPAFVGFLSPDGAVLGCNKLALQAIEATPEQVVGKLFWETPWWKSLPRSASQVNEAVTEAVQGRPSRFEVEYWSIQRGMGQKRWVQLEIRPLMDDAGQVSRIAATGVDLTDQQETQEALRRSEDRLWHAIESSEVATKKLELAHQLAERTRARLSRLFQDAPAFVCSLQGPDHIFEMANPPYQRLLGEQRELLGKAVRDAAPEMVEQGFIRVLDGVYKTATPFIGLETLIKFDRQGTGALEDAFVNFVYQPRFDSEGRVDGIDVFGFDVTEHVRVRQKAEAANEANRILAAAIPQQVWTATPDGALDFVNDRVLQYFRATKEQVLGAGWQSVLHPDDLAVALEKWTCALRTGEEYEIEFRLKRADGVYRWHLGRAVPLRNTEGAIVKWFGTNTDIEETRKLQDELRRSRAAS
jgi:PAS domain S-box-containing protein